jgi:hypothetical protein
MPSMKKSLLKKHQRPQSPVGGDGRSTANQPVKPEIRETGGGRVEDPNSQQWIEIRGGFFS